MPQEKKNVRNFFAMEKSQRRKPHHPCILLLCNLPVHLPQQRDLFILSALANSADRKSVV